MNVLSSAQKKLVQYCLRRSLASAQQKQQKPFKRHFPFPCEIPRRLPRLFQRLDVCEYFHHKCRKYFQFHLQSPTSFPYFSGYRLFRRICYPIPVFNSVLTLKLLTVVYNLNNNTGFVNLGTSHDTAEFAVESIARWWLTVGQYTYPNARKLLITCDGGGSNGSHLRMWKYQLALLSQYTHLEIHVCHFPPGTSKWNKVEHRLFCYITRSWQGQPLVDIQTAVDLISNTTTSTGLKVVCEADYNVYDLGLKVSDDVFASICLNRMDTLGEWNYSINGFRL